MRNAVVFALVALLALGGMAALLSFGAASQDRAFDASVMGVEGLTTWLPDQGVAVARSHPRLSPKAADLSLRILPLYDVDIEATASAPQTKEGLASQTTQRDIEWHVVFKKLEQLPTLLVMPKWRTGFASTAVAHVSLLTFYFDIETLLAQLGLEGLQLVRRPAEFETTTTHVTATTAPSKIALFHAQLFNRTTLPKHCLEIVGFKSGALLIHCKATSQVPAAHYLSDPDILNNHGLSLAGNAGFAAAMIASLRPEGRTAPVYLDTSTELLLDMDEADTEAREYTREPEDLARFFAYPLSVLWGVAAMILAVTLWRGARRFGPPARLDQGRLEGSKTAAIEAKARLLRLSGNDARMAAEFVQARLADLAAQTFGPGMGDAGTARFFALLKSRNASLAADFHAVTTRLTDQSATLSRAELHRLLETFRDLLERVTDGTGPISKPH